MLLFIDVQVMCLVDAPEGSRFVAISYVWGRAAMFKTETSLKSALDTKNGLEPSTIL
jgi:hypothetical protein